MAEVFVDTAELSEILSWLDNWPNGVSGVRLETEAGDLLSFLWSDEFDRPIMSEVT